MLIRRATARECERLFRRELERRGHRFERYKKNRFQLAIGFDTVTNSGVQTAASFSFNITIGSGGTNRLLIVCVGHTKAGGGTSVTGITAGGTAMTFIRSDSQSNEKTELWYLVAPATGTISIAVTLAAAPASCVAGAISLTGVDQASPIDAHNGNTGASTTQPSTSITTIADNAWVVGTVKSSSVDTIVVGASQTQRWNVQDGADADTYGGSSRGPVTPAGATTMSWTGFVGVWEQSVASLKPSSGSPPTNPFFDMVPGSGETGRQTSVVVVW